MAYDGVEVELRFQVDGDVADRLSDRLLAHGAATVEHIDVYFDDPARSFLRSHPVQQWLSVRQRGAQATINHKQFHYDTDGVAAHSDETDLIVQDAAVAGRLLESLGYEPVVSVRKTRLEAELFPGVMVALDDVERLGPFVELEAMRSFGSVDDTSHHLRRCAENLGVRSENLDQRGYPMLMLDLRGRVSLPPT